jgi:hypothetical protein
MIMRGLVQNNRFSHISLDGILNGIILIICVYCFRPWLVVSSQINLHPEYERALCHLAEDHSELLLLEACSGYQQGNYSLRCRGKEAFQYPHVLQVV